MSLIAALEQIQSGNADTPTKDMSNWNGTRNIVNGDLGNVNFGSSDPLAISKTALGTYIAPMAWTPTHTGFSVAPVTTAYYAQVGKIGHIWYDTTPSAGVSNTTGFTITNLPLTPNMITRTPINHHDNGVTSATPGMAITAVGSTTLNLFTNMASAAWTASGNKGVWFYITFTIA